MPNLHRLLQQAAVGLMPVAAPSDPDPNRTWASLSAGKRAVGAPNLGAVRLTPEVGWRTDLAAVQDANRRADTSARVGLLGEALQRGGIRSRVIADRYQERCPAFAVLANQFGWAGGLAVPPAGWSLPDGWIRAALDDCAVVLLSVSSVAEADSRTRPRSPSDLPKPKAAALKEADRLLGLALAALRAHGGRLIVLAPASPDYLDAHCRTLGPVIAYDTRRPESPGLLYSPSTRWPGLVTAADFAPTILHWSEAQARPGADDMDGRVMHVLPAP
ncbi:MAG: hypothetical protein GTO31_08965, partial [Xanthomonadales bacterium]|nr:hypothetical protein [Xanthomonadales bacterium]